MTYIEDEETREDVIQNIGRSLLKNKEVTPAIVCFILSNSVDDVLNIWRMRANHQIKQAQNLQQI
jgi:hypothetical protein